MKKSLDRLWENPKSTQKDIKKNKFCKNLIFLYFYLFLLFYFIILSIFKFFISIYKMEPRSLKSICEKVIFLNINNTKKLKDLSIEGLKERKKMLYEGEDYKQLLHFLKEHSYFYDDYWRYCFFLFYKGK